MADEKKEKKDKKVKETPKTTDEYLTKRLAKRCNY